MAGGPKTQENKMSKLPSILAIVLVATLTGCAVKSHCLSSALQISIVKDQERIVKCLGQNGFAISAKSEETMNAGLIGVLYLSRFWTPDPAALQINVYDAKSYGITMYSSISGKTYGQYVKEMQALGREAVSKDWHKGVGRMLQEDVGLVDLPLYDPYPKR